MTVDIELLEAGSTDEPPGRNSRLTRWLMWGVAIAAGTTVVVLAIGETAPSLGGEPTTQLRLLVLGRDGLVSIDVDSGQVTPILADPDVDEVTSVGEATVVQVPNDDRIFADTVVAFSDASGERQLGEADRVVPDPNGGLWLVIDATNGVDGGAALTSIGGGSRSRVFSVPANRQIVGATDDGLITLTGRHRDRLLQLWDPQLGQVVRSMGLVTGVVGVEQSTILVSRGCLSQGCDIALVDATTGDRTSMVPPAGWVESGPAVLQADGQSVAQVVSGVDGITALAVGPPGDMLITSEVTPAVAASLVVSDGGWIVVTQPDGDAVVVRGSQQRTVEIPPFSKVVGVS